ncbi:MAG: DUF3276 family protein [Saprospiraceae bacterium]
MDNERNQRRFESVFSKKVRAGKRRTYFFDVRRTKGDDFYLTLTESTRRFNGEGYERHKIFLYKEDFNRFLDGLTETIDHVKTELMPEYDYDEYTRRHAEWEANQEEEGYSNSSSNDDTTEKVVETLGSSTDEMEDVEIEETKEVENEDDISW